MQFSNTDYVTITKRKLHSFGTFTAAINKLRAFAPIDFVSVTATICTVVITIAITSSASFGLKAFLRTWVPYFDIWKVMRLFGTYGLKVKVSVSFFCSFWGWALERYTYTMGFCAIEWYKTGNMGKRDTFSKIRVTETSTTTICNVYRLRYHTYIVCLYGGWDIYFYHETLSKW